ncbi:MAG: YebC/PmpR family DNA-binding transcriptional regulator [Clostridia bacterium]
MGRIHNIEGKKNKMDSQRGKVFNKHARSIYVAAKAGGEVIEYNAALKIAVDKAKADNMPNDNIARAIKKASGGDGEHFDHITYEGYGPGGVAIIIEVLTDNKNRTAANIRHHLDKNGGNLGTSGCVGFMFDRKGLILIESADSIDEDALMELAIESGAEDVVIEEDGYEIITEPNDFAGVKEALEGAGYVLISAEITMLPSSYTELEGKQVARMERLVDMLEDDDDVQEIYHNLKQ